MKPVNKRNLGVRCAILVFWAFAGCTSQQMAQTHRDKEDNCKNSSYWRGIEPTRIAKLVIAINNEHQSFAHFVTINEPKLVQSVYLDLVSRQSLPMKRYLMIA